MIVPAIGPARIDMIADQGTGQAHLRRGDEVGHVALERPLRRIGAELQQEVERRDGDRGLDVARPTRKTRSSVEPTTMYGFRRPQRLVV